MITSGKDLVECYKEIAKRKAIRENQFQMQYDEQIGLLSKKKQDFYANMVKNDKKRKEKSKMLDYARNDVLSTALKAIYITAMEASTLTDDGIVLAETLVDRWIQENGGAYNILSKVKNNTYFLSRLTQIVEDAAKDEVEKVKDSENDTGESEKKEEEKPKEEEKEKKEEKSDSEKDPLNDTGFKDDEDEEPETKDNEKKEDDSNSKETETEKDSEEDKKDDSKEKSSNDDPLGTDGTDDEEEVKDKDSDSSSDDTGVEDMDNDGDIDETDVAHDIADDVEDVPDEDITIDGDTENKGKVFDDLEKEEDVKKAIEIIRNRVADAEETFIKRNAEDKKKIDELIDRISNNVKTVKDMNDQAETDEETEQELNKSGEESKEGAAQESVRVARRRVNQSIQNRPHNLLEFMTNSLAKQITKDRVIREEYMGDDGRMDIQRIFEAGKVMYGFLETLNTLQLQNIDKEYIKKLIHEM